MNAGVVYVGGLFTHINDLPRNQIAAIDAATGTAADWDPNASGSSSVVYALAASEGVVYAGGMFTSIGGQSRRGIAALAVASGLATAWDPNLGGSPFQVTALLVDRDVVYVGGAFTGMGGQPRNNIAALDAATATATNWNPSASSSVNALASAPGVIYAAGYFTSIGGQARSRIAALDSATGQATDWNPSTERNNPVVALAVNGGTVYAGGFFNSMGGQVRNALAALDASTGAATSWNPNPVPFRYSLVVVSGSTHWPRVQAESS